MTRAAATIAWLLFAAFCAYRFLASYEPDHQLGWNIRYPLFFCGALVNAALPWFRKPQQEATSP
jgi:hypothetical protein